MNVEILTKKKWKEKKQKWILEGLKQWNENTFREIYNYDRFIIFFDINSDMNEF